MRIETIKLENFKAFKDVEITGIPQFCVFVGANGTGKSTLFQAFSFLKECMTYNVYSALEKFGGFEEVISRTASSRYIALELQFRTGIAGVERLITYRLEIAEMNKRPYIRRELLRYKRGRHGSPFHFLDFKNGSGYAVLNEEDFNKEDEKLDREEQSLDNTILAIKGLGQFDRFKAASSLRQLIENWNISDFHISDARGVKEATGYEDHLSESGDNLQRVAYKLHENNPEIFEIIVRAIAKRVPGISNVVPIKTRDKRILLTFQDKSFSGEDTAFIDSFVSDGTMKMFAYLVLLNDPKPHSVLCIEEPENQLYPTLLGELAEEMADYARRGGQVFVSTHSPDFLNAISPESVFWLVKNDGYTSVRHASDSDQIMAYIADGEKMGNLWKEGWFDGASP